MTREITDEQAKDLQMTLQYCLETFEAACQCGECDPCTRGQEDIRRNIATLDDILNQSRAGLTEVRHKIAELGSELMALVKPTQSEMQSFTTNFEDVGHCDGCIAGYIYDERVSGHDNQK